MAAAAVVCPICGGTGWKIIERAGLSGAEPCRCAEEARAEALQKGANIPLNYEHATLANFVPPEDNPMAKDGLIRALLKVKAFVREFPTADHPGLLLVGSPGTGKTHLAVAALKAIMDKGHEGIFFDYQNLLDRIRSSYDKTSGSSDKETYRLAMDAEVLLLDDLGSHRVTEWVEDTVTSLVTYRCNHRKPLIVTTNLDPEYVAPVAYTTPGGTDVHKKSLGEVIGERARSRLFEMCRVVRMQSTEDYRVKHAR